MAAHHSTGFFVEPLQALGTTSRNLCGRQVLRTAVRDIVGGVDGEMQQFVASSLETLCLYTLLARLDLQSRLSLRHAMPMVALLLCGLWSARRRRACQPHPRQPLSRHLVCKLCTLRDMLLCPPTPPSPRSHARTRRLRPRGVRRSQRVAAGRRPPSRAIGTSASLAVLWHRVPELAE